MLKKTINITYASTKKNFLVNSNYISKGTSSSDLGIIKTDDDLSSYGKFELNTSYKAGKSHSYTVKGYPDGNGYSSGYQYYSTGGYSSYTSPLLKYTASTDGGMSGSPVIYGSKVVAINVEGGTDYNVGTTKLSWFDDYIS